MMRSRSKAVRRRAVRAARPDAEAVLRALRTQHDPEADDRSLIRERIAWSPAERLAANGAFVAFAFAVRPQGPFLRD
jgi:hypothetical protein